MAGHFVAPAAFLMQSLPRGLAVSKLILDPQRCDGTDPGEAVYPRRQLRPVAQPLSSVSSIEFKSCRAGVLTHKKGQIARLPGVKNTLRFV